MTPGRHVSIAPDAITTAPARRDVQQAGRPIALRSAGPSRIWRGTITNGGVTLFSAIDHVVATSTVHANYHVTAIALVSETSTPFSSTADTRAPRELHTSTLLPNGKVLVAGGGHPAGYCLSGVSSAEVFDPAAGSFVSTGIMTIERYSRPSTANHRGIDRRRPLSIFCWMRVRLWRVRTTIRAQVLLRRVARWPTRAGHIPQHC